MYLYTLSNLLTMTRTILNEPTASFWTDGILTAYLNDGVKAVAESAGSNRTTQVVSTVAGVRTVAVTGYKCLAVEYNNVSLINIAQLQAGHGKIDDIIPKYWFQYGDYIVIEPIPSSVYQLTLYLIAEPSELVAITDIPDIPYAFCSLLPYYASARALEQEKAVAPASQFLNMFYSELGYMSGLFFQNNPITTEDTRTE